ncbi:EamA-like transporter family protein [Nitzschia inconspicua]|uniref:EamA-like transporter family protein n=1 Tax=Nitzschia inconspicua TaxID=303405 RepID=A0A9K3L7T2_9STRA|nr:EamA-like transporter family protein [Nitzschia inconspicua]
MKTSNHLCIVVLGTLLILITKAASFSAAYQLVEKSTTQHHNQRIRSFGGEIGHFRVAKPEFRCTTLSVGVSGGDGNNESIKKVELDSAALVKGRFTLCVVALLYGTLNVSLRLIYQLPEPPTASALSAARGVLACVGFLPLLLVGRQPDANSKADESISDGEPAESSSSQIAPFLWAGFELAFYNFLAQGLLNIGLLSTSSARASFLTQTSVVFTPVLSRIFGQRVPSNVWIACGLALVGLTVLSSAATTTTALGSYFSSPVSFTTGDCLVLGGAVSWSLYLYRLSKLGPKFDEVNLQFVKSIMLAVLYAVWLVATIVTSEGIAADAFMTVFVSQPFGWLINGAAFLTILYSAVGPGTVADVLQQQGQKEVSASEANVILSLEPVFTALCAWAILGELTSFREAIGGAIILAAASVATR